MLRPVVAEDSSLQPLPAEDRSLRPRVSLRKLLLPAEHGGWGFLIEPLLLGMVVAPSWSGLLIALAALAAFISRQPIKLAASDRVRGKSYPRTRVAAKWGAGLAAAAALLLGAAAILGGTPLLLPLLLAAPLVVIQLARDATSSSRALEAELSGAVATGSAAAAVAVAGGLTWPVAFSLWALSTARSVPAVAYVRARIRIVRGEPARRPTALVVHAAAFAVAIGLRAAGTAPALASAALALLFLRAWAGLSPSSARTTAQRVGFAELAWGGLTVALVAAGYLLDW